MIKKEEQYNDMWAKYNAGEITTEVWMAFCMEVFEEILSEPEVIAVLERLKQR